MSNPCINRWGMNTFWYNFWYADHRYAYTLNQDAAFIKLIHTYLLYGINVSDNIFANSYWHLKNAKPLNFASYWRTWKNKDSLYGGLTVHTMRYETDCIFPMRMWILRYNKWIIINLAWFKPFKKKPQLNRWADRYERDLFNTPSSKQTSGVRRLKMLTSLIFFNNVCKNMYYRF
jgi:hypothetical protein